MKVVANTTPIISLASIGRLDLLERLFGSVLIAEAVYREIKAKPGYGYCSGFSLSLLVWLLHLEVCISIDQGLHRLDLPLGVALLHRAFALGHHYALGQQRSHYEASSIS